MIRNAIAVGIGAGVVLSVAGCDQVPDKMRQLMRSNEPVKAYQSFSEINAAKPLAAKFDMDLGAILRMAFINKTLKYEIVPPASYNESEKSVLKFFEHPGLQKSLKLVNYARQLKAEHPYRINPFIPFFTLRKENWVFAQTKSGPAALVNAILQQKGPYEGRVDWKDYQGNSYQFDVKMSPQSVPRAGALLLFDHDEFSIASVIDHPETNILQDIIAHEFTHVWNFELLSDRARADSSVESNKTEVGHDTMIVSNPSLAFSEGLAEAFEALYGGTSSQLMNMTREERKKFFGQMKDGGSEIARKLDFLVNRQVYIRRNAYLYNLYDFKDCTLRVVKAKDASELGGRKLRPGELLDRVLRGENVDLAEADREFNFENFQDRFYGDSERVSPQFLREHCKLDSPGRLESKEGFVASLFYDVIGSGALVADEELRAPAAVVERDPAKAAQSAKKQRLEHFRTFAKNSMVAPQNWKAPYLPAAQGTGGRALADNAERLKVLERNFLLGFRPLALGISKAQPNDLQDLLSYYFSSDSFLTREQQVKLAFQVLKASAGTFFKAENANEKRFQELFSDSKLIAENLEAIHDQLERMFAARDLGRVAGRLGEVPAVYVEVKTERQSETGETLTSVRRWNVNVAHHIDLIKIFRQNSPAIHELAKRLDRGEYFRNETEFLDFAASIGKQAEARTMIEDAQKSIRELEKLRLGGLRGRDLVSSTLE